MKVTRSIRGRLARTGDDWHGRCPDSSACLPRPLHNHVAQVRVELLVQVGFVKLLLNHAAEVDHHRLHTLPPKARTKTGGSHILSARNQHQLRNVGRLSHDAAQDVDEQMARELLADANNGIVRLGRQLAQHLGGPQEQAQLLTFVLQAHSGLRKERRMVGQHLLRQPQVQLLQLRDDGLVALGVALRVNCERCCLEKPACAICAGGMARVRASAHRTLLCKKPLCLGRTGW